MKHWIFVFAAIFTIAFAGCSDDTEGQNGQQNDGQQNDGGEVDRDTGTTDTDDPQQDTENGGGADTDQVCIPGQWSCVDEQSRHQCNDDGTDWGEPVDCPAEELCSAGSCDTTCVLDDKLFASHFGCEYWAVYLDQYEDPFTNIDADDVAYAIVVSNPNEEPTTVLFETFDSEVVVDVEDPVVPPGESRAFELPRVELDGSGITRRGIFVRSTRPVTAHQFNPQNNQDVYSNDASLLFPVSSLGTNYFVMNWPSQMLPCLDPDDDMMCPDPQYSYLTVIAASEGTTNVVINSTADMVGGEEFEDFPPGVGRNFELEYGEVLNLRAGQEMTGEVDLTGTVVNADQPIVLFAGHEQAVISYDDDRDSCCADHIEQQIWPVENLSDHYVASFSPGRTETKDHWRILAAEDGVTVQTDPPQPEADGVQLDAGEFVAFFSDEDFEVEADGKVMVGQFLTGQGQTAEIIGDPAFTLAVPVERYRDHYLVLVPEDYHEDYITIIRPAGLEVELEGDVVDDEEFTPVGSGEFETAAIEVESGVYELEADESFGVLVHGLDNAVSYSYPGGLDIVGEEDEVQDP